MEPKSVDAGRGVNWWTDGWALFMKNPGMWIVLALVLLLICMLLSMVPLLGSLTTTLLLPAFAASWMLACRKVEGGGNLEVGDLFLGFKDQLNPLLVLGALFLAASMVVTIVMSLFGFGALMGIGLGAAMSSPGTVLAAVSTGLIGLLIGLGLLVPIMMAFWFAPALVVFDQVAPVESLKLSFAASLKNIGPFFVNSVIGIVIALLLPFTLFLGLLVVVPVSLMAVYLSYRDVFSR